ncbi:MAG: CHAT domain-containing tetratricopeptide repeat protein, partial [Actinomycetota bacterium]
MKLQNIGVATLAALATVLAVGDVPVFRKSQWHFSTSQALAQNPTERKAQADRLFQQGREQYQVSQFQAALQSWRQALSLYREIHDRNSEGQALGNLGVAYRNLGDYGKAIEYAQQWLAIAREIRDRSSEGGALNNLGLAYGNLGDYGKAIEYAQQSLAIAREIKDRNSEGKALGNLGIAYLDLGDYPKAIEYTQQLLAIAREIRDRSSERGALNNLGLAYYSLGDYGKAIEYAQQSLAIAREIRDRRGEGAALGNLGLAYLSLGDYGKAIEYSEQLLAIAREIRDRQGEGRTLGNLGVAYYSLGDYGKAIEYAQQSLAIAREIRDRRGEGAALGNLGLAYYSLGDYDKAIEYAQQLLAIAREIKDRQSEGKALGNLGVAYSNLGDYGKAIEYTQQWLAIAQEIKDRNSEGLALNNLGFALYRQGNLPAAEKILYESILVAESLRAGLEDAKKVSIFDTQTNPYINLQQVLITQKKTQEALAIAERGRARAFVELLATRLSTSASAQIPITPPTIEQIQQIAKEHNATLVEYSIISNQALFIWVIKPSGEIDFRSVDLQSGNINLKEAAENTRIAAGSDRGLTESDSALAEMIRGTRDSLGVPDISFNQNANSGQNALPTTANINPQLQQLYQLLIKPIDDLLPADPNASVIFIPHQSLFLVPFAALQDDKGQYLIEKHTILTAPSIQVLQLTRQAKQKVQQLAPQDIVIVGNPTMPKVGNPPRQLPPLPGSEQEAQLIGKLLNVQPIIGAQATKVALIEKMRKARIVHLATHGLLNEVKRREIPGAIALAPSGTDDGLLTSSEILDLTINAELVVLSACNTGRGTLTGDGVLGLSRSLITAGVPSILGSLWYVPDASTADLMVEFYRQWQLNPNKAQALRQAMLIIMKK